MRGIIRGRRPRHECLLQQCVDNYDIVALSPGGQGYILDAIDGNPDTGLRIERYGLTLTSSQIPDKVLIKAGSGLTGPMVRMRNDVSIPFEISYITFDGNRFNRPRNSDPNYCGYTGLDLRCENCIVKFSQFLNMVCGSGLGRCRGALCTRRRTPSAQATRQLASREQAKRRIPFSSRFLPTRGFTCWEDS